MIRDYVALDLETTGLSPRKDTILEIGAVRVKDMKVQDQYAALIISDSGAYYGTDRHF